MLAPEEISALSLDEISEEITSRLSGGSSLTSEYLPGRFLVRVVGLDGEILLEEAHVDERLAHLNLLGRLWLNNAPDPTSPWVRRRELTQEASLRNSLSGVDDPEDLDPDEVEAVYKNYRRI